MGTSPPSTYSVLGLSWRPEVRGPDSAKVHLVPCKRKDFLCKRAKLGYIRGVSSLEVAFVSVLVGAFCVLLLAALGLAIYAAWRAKKSADALSQWFTEVQAKTDDSLATQAEELTKILESSKSNFTGIRTEVRSALEMFSDQYRQTLEAHQQRMDAAVSKINAEELSKASKTAVAACREFQRIAAALQGLLLNTERATEDDEDVEEPPAGKPWPDERAADYAPKGQSSVYDSVQYRIEPSGPITGEEEAPI